MNVVWADVSPLEWIPSLKFWFSANSRQYCESGSINLRLMTLTPRGPPFHLRDPFM